MSRCQTSLFGTWALHGLHYYICGFHGYSCRSLIVQSWVLSLEYQERKCSSEWWKRVLVGYWLRSGTVLEQCLFLCRSRGFLPCYFVADGCFSFMQSKERQVSGSSDWFTNFIVKSRFLFSSGLLRWRPRLKSVTLTRVILNHASKVLSKTGFQELWPLSL